MTADADKPAARPEPAAFVVQLQPSGHGGDGVLRGRVEHLASGAEARFGSAEELLTFLRSRVPVADVPEPANEREGNPR